jgi:hypothetical protein
MHTSQFGNVPLTIWVLCCLQGDACNIQVPQNRIKRPRSAIGLIVWICTHF